MLNIYLRFWILAERFNGFKPSKTSFSVESRSNQYKYHPSIVNIIQNALNNTHTDILSFSTDKINSIIKSLDTNRALGTDKIPMELIILASDVLSKPISKTFNNCVNIRTTLCITFAEKAKVATVVLIDKETDDKVCYVYVCYTYQ